MKTKKINDLQPSVIINAPKKDILKIKATDWEEIKTLTEKIKDSYQKGLVQELILGKKREGAGNGYISSLIKPIYIKDFCDFYTKNTELFQKLPTTIVSELDRDFYKNYLVAKFLEHKQIKDGKTYSETSWNPFKAFSKFQTSESKSWYYRDGTIKNNENFLDELFRIKNDKQFTGRSYRSLKSGQFADNNALSSMAIDFAKCSSHANKQVYRRAFYETLELLGCGGYKDERKGFKVFEWKQQNCSSIPCSPDEFSLLVNALIAERRSGYNINKLKAILEDTKSTTEEKTPNIHKYCENNKDWLLDCQEFNQKLLGSSSYSDGPFLSGIVGGTLRMGFNNTIGYGITALNSALYCLTPYPSTSVQRAEAKKMRDELELITDRK